MYNLRDHPDIEWTLKTGYPNWLQENEHEVYCEECGKPLEDGSIYEDEAHYYLCEGCLLLLHEKNVYGVYQ